MGKGKSTADKFSTLFDQDWVHTKSRIRTRIDSNQRPYDLTNSWDARTDNPQSFSKLDHTVVPLQQTTPIVLSGSAVLQLERNEGFNGLNVIHPSHATSHSKVPLTIQQKDLQMNDDLTGSIPQLDHARRANMVLLVERPSTYENMSMQGPLIKEATIPDFVEEAGPQADQRLLNPTQRRELHHFQLQKQRADQMLKSAQSERDKVRKQLGSLKYHRGALMIDSSDNVDSEVYGDRAKLELAEKEYKRQIHLERRSRLATKNSSLITNGNLLVPDTLGPRVKLEKNYQSKGGDYHGLSFDETHNRLFCRTQIAPSSQRTQLLRDIDLSGKDYNITQHTILEHWPPREFKRQVDRNMAHPSQAALEHGRNLQGTLRPY